MNEIRNELCETRLITAPDETDVLQGSLASAHGSATNEKFIFQTLTTVAKYNICIIAHL